jgi:hypothetical protein
MYFLRRLVLAGSAHLHCAKIVQFKEILSLLLENRKVLRIEK